MQYYSEGGWWLPDRELHIQQYMRKANKHRGSRLLYQDHKYQAALKWVRPTRRNAIDIGAHVGFWSWQMAQDFKHVIAFEPMLEHCDCCQSNMIAQSNFYLFNMALGNETKKAFVRIRPPGSPGDNGTDPAAERSSLRACIENAEGEPCTMTTLDSFGFDNVDFLKIDTEGYELFILEGAIETLKRCKPCCIVEQKAETGGAEHYGIGVTDAVTFLKKLGAVQRCVVQGDYVLSW